MHPGIQLDVFEHWLPRRAALQAGLWIWVAGFAVAGATAWRLGPCPDGWGQGARRQDPRYRLVDALPLAARSQELTSREVGTK